MESPLLSSELLPQICLSFRSPSTNSKEHTLIRAMQVLSGFQQKGGEVSPDLEVRLTSESYTSKTHSGWHQLSVKMIHPKEDSRSRDLKRYEKTLLEEGVQGLL